MGELRTQEVGRMEEPEQAGTELSIPTADNISSVFSAAERAQLYSILETFHEAGLDQDQLKARLDNLDEVSRPFFGGFSLSEMRYFNPKYLPTVVYAEYYKHFDDIPDLYDHSNIEIFQVLPDNRVVVGRHSGSIVVDYFEDDQWKEDWVVIEKPGVSNGIESLQALPNGDIIAGGIKGDISVHTKKGKLWFSEVIEKPVEKINEALSVYAVKAFPDGSFLAGKSNGEISLYRQVNGKWEEKRILDGNKQGIAALELQIISENQFVAGMGDAHVYIFNRVGDRWEKEVVDATDSINAITDIQVLPNGDIAISKTRAPYDDGAVVVYHRKNNKWEPEKLFESIGRIDAIQFLPDGRIVLTNKESGIMMYWKEGGDWRKHTICDNTHLQASEHVQVLSDGKIFFDFVNKIKIFEPKLEENA